VPRSRRGDGWDALADIEVFVFAVEAELEAMDRERVGMHRRGRKPGLALRRRLIGLSWTLTFGGMQWRIAGWLSGIPFTTLHSAFARWTRLGPWAYAATLNRSPMAPRTLTTVSSSGCPIALRARYRLSRDRPASRATPAMPRARAAVPSALAM
jgi:hypothetical protein